MCQPAIVLDGGRPKREIVWHPEWYPGDTVDLSEKNDSNSKLSPLFKAVDVLSYRWLPPNLHRGCRVWWERSRQTFHLPIKSCKLWPMASQLGLCIQSIRFVLDRITEKASSTLQIASELRWSSLHLFLYSAVQIYEIYIFIYLFDLRTNLLTTSQLLA